MADPNARTVGDWVLQQRIGSGSFAVVWKASHKTSGRIAAIKEISTDRLNKKLKQSLESEVSILKQIRHKNIVHLEDVIEASNYLYLVMEYCAGGDLAGYIRRYRQRVPEVTACAVMRQLGAGLQELCTRQMVHRDLKPQNLLLSDSTDHAVLKIADFGFARHLQQQELADTLCGSPLYMAPEILQSHKYDAKADLWSVGTILYELVVGKPPFNGINHVELLRNIERREPKIPDQIARTLSPACIDLIYSLLKRIPVQRMSFEEFFVHPFLAGSAPLAASVAPAWQAQAGATGETRPVQRLAGQAANSPDDSLPFVLDDDAVAPAYEQALQQQQVEGEALPQQRAGPILHRPSFGHRNPASAAAGRHFVQAASSSKPPLGASPHQSGGSLSGKPPSFPATPPLQPAAPPAASHGISTQIQGRLVANHPLQVGRGSNSMGSSMEDEGFVIVNVPSPNSSGHQPSSRRSGRGGYAGILTRLRSEPLPPQPHAPPAQEQQPIQQQQLQRANTTAHVPVASSHRPAQQHGFAQTPAATTDMSRAPPRLKSGHSQEALAPELRAGYSQEAAASGPHAAPQAQHCQPALQPEAEPDMATPHAFARLAALLEEVATVKDSKQQPEEALSLRLLAMQLLLLALGKQIPDSDRRGPATQGGSALPASAADQPQQSCHQQQKAVDTAAQPAQEQQQRVAQRSSKVNSNNDAGSFQISVKDLRQRLFDMAAKADEAALALKGEAGSAMVPYVWQLVYAAALDLARTGAMQEVICHFSSCMEPYTQGVSLLVFLHAVAGNLTLQPPLLLAKADRLRLEHFSQQLRHRQAVCKAALKGSQHHP